MSKTDNILSPAEAAVLQSLSRAAMTFADLREVTQMGRSRINIVQLGLRERRMALGTRCGSQSPMLIAITSIGQQALIDHHARLESETRTAQPATFVRVEVYQPPKGTFYRNSGNSHIPSRGVRC